MLSYQSPVSAGAGTPRCEKLELWLGTANWHRGFCHAQARPQRGTSPRTTFPNPHPSGFRLSPEGRMGAGTTSKVAAERHPGSGCGTCFRTNRSCRLLPAHQGMKIGTAHTPLDSGAVSGFGSAFDGETKWGRRVEVGGGIAVDVVSRNVSAWIPAFAGMTNVGVRWRTRKPFKGIFVLMTSAGDSRVCRNDGARRNDAAGGGIRRLVLPVGWAHPTVPYV